MYKYLIDAYCLPLQVSGRALELNL